MPHLTPGLALVTPGDATLWAELVATHGRDAVEAACLAAGHLPARLAWVQAQLPPTDYQPTSQHRRPRTAVVRRARRQRRAVRVGDVVGWDGQRYRVMPALMPAPRPDRRITRERLLALRSLLHCWGYA